MKTGLKHRQKSFKQFCTGTVLIVLSGTDGIKEVLENLNRHTFKKLHFVLGVVNDKDISKILMLLPKDAIYYFCKASIPRALDEKDLMTQAKTCGLNGSSFKKAKKQAKINDLIFVGGSTFTVADIL